MRGCETCGRPRTELLALLTEVRERPNAKVEDILAVHRSLTQIREEIEMLQGRKNLLDNQIDFSTIWVELIPDSVFRPIRGGSLGVPAGRCEMRCGPWWRRYRGC